MNLWLRAVLPIALIVLSGAAATLVARAGTRRDRQRELARRNVERTVRTGSGRSGARGGIAVADLDLRLDPYTLRAVAREQHDRAIALRAACACDLHSGFAVDADALAADLRTLAIRVDQAREAATKYVPGALPSDLGQSAPDGGTGGGALLTGASAPANPEPTTQDGDGNG